MIASVGSITGEKLLTSGRKVWYNGLMIEMEEVLIIGIVGSRRRDTQSDFEAVESKFLELYNPGDTICSGLCKTGADRFAVVLAEKYQTKKLWYPANWARYGRGAGLVRNTDIARDSDILIACVASDRTGGTEDTIRKYLKFGKTKLYLV